MWNNCTQIKSFEIEQIQYEAVHTVIGATRLASDNSQLTETGWETLSSRSKNISLLCFTICKITGVQSCLRIFTRAWNRWIISYNLGNAGDIQTVNTYTQLYYTSFYLLILGIGMAFLEKFKLQTV